MELRSASVSPEVAEELCATAAGFHARGWMLGTSGNLSAVQEREPLRLAVSASGVDKGRLSPDQILCVDAAGSVLGPAGRASDETGVHLSVIRATGAGAVLHTHSVWNNLAAEGRAGGAVWLEGHEMLKGLSGVRSHEHRERIPVLANTQDYAALSQAVEQLLRETPGLHALLLHRHGLYTWGEDLAAARRHVEILEFLFEFTCRLATAGAS
jgi:methylthioribulose-1-phosphate dehydratase